jgi:hypothetical protein
VERECGSSGDMQSFIRKSKLLDWKKKSRSEKYILIAKSFTKTLQDRTVEMIDLKQLFQIVS